MAKPLATSKDNLGKAVDIAVPGKKVAENAFSGAITLISADLIGSADSHGVEEIGEGAFEDCLSLSRVQARDDVKIGPYAFADCLSLSNAWFYDHRNGLLQVGTIGEGAFQECRSLAYVNLRSKGIGKMAFQNCTALKKCEVDELEEIGDLAFDGCGSLRSVTMPSKVGQYAFRDCTSLTEVIVQEGPHHYISPGTFSGCTALASVTIPDSILFIQENAFWGCSALKSVQTTATTIGEHAFQISGLESIKIGDGADLRRHAFANCHRLRDVEGRIGTIGPMAFKECTSLQSITLPTRVYPYAFYGCRGLTEVVVPDQTREIASGTFEGCTALASVEIPESVFSINESAFKNCEALESVRTNANIIRQSAFKDCHALKSVILTYTSPETVLIHEGAFKRCYALEEVVIAAKKVQIGPKAFANCVSLKVVTVPENSSIYSTAFQGSSVEKLVVLGELGQHKQYLNEFIESEEGIVESEEGNVEGYYSAKDNPLKIMGWTAANHKVLPENDKEKARTILFSLQRNVASDRLPHVPQEMRQMMFKPQPSDVYTKSTQRLNDRVAPE